MNQPPRNTILQGDALALLRRLPDEYVQTVVTSPPYWGLRDYGTAAWEGSDPACAHEHVSAAERTPWANSVPGPNGLAKNTVAGHWKAKTTGGFCDDCGAVRIDSQIGLEPTLAEYIANMVALFREVKRVLCKDGTAWVNMGDSYASNWPCNRRSEIGSGSLANGKREARPPRMSGNLKDKDLCGVPWRLAFALQDDGWWLRSDIIWSKLNPMPESVTDRPTRSHEYIFLLSKSQRYYYDAAAIREPLAAKTYTTFGTSHRAQGNDALGGVKSDNWGRTVGMRQPKQWKTPDGWDTSTGEGGHGTIHREGRTDKQRGHGRRHDGVNDRWDHMSKEEQQALGANKRDVWTVATHPFPEAHFATFPPALIEPCILAGSRPGDLILDPFMGSGTTAIVAVKHSRDYLGCELNPDYIAMAERRLARGVQMSFASLLHVESPPLSVIALQD